MTPILSVKNTPFTFFVFSPLCMPRFVKTFSSPNFWGVKKALCKKFHVFGENWQRNHFPKLTTLLLLLHPCYNFPIVQWWWSSQKPLKMISSEPLRFSMVFSKTIENGLFKTIEIFNWSPQIVEFNNVLNKNGTFLWSQLQF